MEEDIKKIIIQIESDFFIYFGQDKVISNFQKCKNQIIEQTNEDQNFQLFYQQLQCTQKLNVSVSYDKISKIRYFEYLQVLFPNYQKLVLSLDGINKLEQKQLQQIGQSINKQQSLKELEIDLVWANENDKFNFLLQNIFQNEKIIEKICIKCQNILNKQGSDIVNAIQIINFAQNLKQLQLKIQQTEENNQSLVKLGESLLQLKQLDELSLIIEKEQQLNNDNTVLMFQIISKVKSIQKLQLNVIGLPKIQKKQLLQIKQCSRELYNLIKFHVIVQGQEIDTESAQILGDIFSGLSNLQDLVLEIDSLSINQKAALFSPVQGNLFEGLTRLKTLNLTINKNKMQEKGFNFISNSLAKINNLQKLSLKIKPQFHQIQTNFLSEFLNKSSQLQFLDLSIFDLMNDQTLSSLGDGISNLSHLHFLRLNILPTSIQVLQKFFHQFQSLKQLKELSIVLFVQITTYTFAYSIEQRNQIKKIIYQQLVQSIKNLPNLFSLAFKFDGNIFPKSDILIRKSKKLVVVK